ncbi:MAG: hypothetical protein KGZ68_10340 [Dechloromonas sp.]|nr:hypothetical protein [Dechloromonas sp.]
MTTANNPENQNSKAAQGSGQISKNMKRYRVALLVRDKSGKEFRAVTDVKAQSSCAAGHAAQRVLSKRGAIAFIRHYSTVQL